MCPAIKNPPSVVSITIEARPDSESEWEALGHGSGFVIDEDGHIVSNYHVVGPSEEIQ